MQYRTILFDLSGTLIDYRGPVVGWEAMERLGFTAVHTLLHSNGHRDQMPAADHFHTAAFTQLRRAWKETLAGERNLHLADLLREALAAQGVHPTEATIAEAVRCYTRAISAGASPRLGAAELLATLRAEGRRVGLISNTMWPGAHHHLDLERFGLAPHIEVEIYSADRNAWKPSPRVFNLALDALDASPESTLFVGDNPVDDVIGARNSGLGAVWITTGEYPIEAGGAADAIIHELPELVGVLRKLEG